MQEHEKWLAIAQDDLKGAKILFKHEFFTKVAYDCQQAYEKSLKGYLAFKDQEIIKTHDLIKLLKMCASIDSNFNKHHKYATFVNPFSTRFRYPTEFDIIDHDEALQAIKYTEKILKFVFKKISEPETGQKNIF